MIDISFSGLFSCLIICEGTLKSLDRVTSRYFDLETSLEPLSKEFKYLARACETYQIFPKLSVWDEQSGGKSSTLETVHQPLFSQSSISWKTCIGGILIRISSLESYCMNQSSSFERAKGLNEISRLAGEIGSFCEILDRGLKKLTYNGSKSELLRRAKRVFSGTYDPMLSQRGFAMQFGQQLQPNDKIFGRSLLEEALELRSMNVGWPYSYTQSSTEVPRNSFVVRDTAIGMTDVAIMEARLRFGTESDVFASWMITKIGVRRSVYSYGLTVHHICRSDTETRLEDWTQKKACAQAPPRVFPLPDRFATVWVKPAPSEWPLCSLGNYGEGAYVPEALIDEIITKVSDPFIGDEVHGPNTGEPNMGRDDDDDDDFVGFHKFSGPAERSSALFHGGERHGRARENRLLGADQRGTIPKFGPPKRDPVAAVIGGNVKSSVDETTFAIWRDAITRTCVENTGLGPMAVKKREEIGWKSAWAVHGDARGEEGLMRAY